jgi:hypothetical protein
MADASNNLNESHERVWHYLKAGVAMGPLSIDELRGLALSADTLLWRKGMPGWEPLSRTPIASAVKSMRSSDLPPPPPASSPMPVKASAESAPPTGVERWLQESTVGKLLIVAFWLCVGIFAVPALWNIGKSIGGGVLSWANGPTYQDSIVRVLNADRESSARIAATAGFGDQYWDASPIIGRVVDGMQAIDTSGCPEDFQEAYRDHIKAWQKMQGVATRYGGMNGFVQGFLSLGTALGDAIEDGNEAQHEVTTTYQNLLQSARRHGVDIGRYQSGP